jgi:hypothetical protein
VARKRQGIRLPILSFSMATILATGVRRFFPLVASAITILFGASAVAARPTISEDRELKEIDLAGWNCRNNLEGGAKTPDGAERNRLKNRSASDLTNLNLKPMETASFLQYLAAFDAQTRGTRRKDLGAAQRRQLGPLEKQIVSFAGYLVLAYAGPPKSTNCGSTDFHDLASRAFRQATRSCPANRRPDADHLRNHAANPKRHLSRQHPHASPCRLYSRT